MRLITLKSDALGMFASTLCLLHCIATPFLFLVHASASCCSVGVPTWWKLVDYCFLIISGLAVYYSIQTTTSNNIKQALWVSWFLLFLVIMNENLKIFHIPEFFNYIPAIVLVVLHLYNQRYCQCETDKC
ncbi:MerC domain-containing protein [Tenacibaculum sp. M341]|uniref:MerC domain-containing protein n=1 Tax=Tenacibaculum sp. M341 TaxID=2530339 RepID=UPI00104D8954|nr:MerC domain-containing protein [Tenacibaculum sp. M341]TCI94769.1 MerC domain-containing protein [Tenacibaculum sp. M341]